MLYPGTRKIVLGDKEFSMLSVFQLDGDNKNVATLLKPEDLNIGSVLDIPLTTTENYFNIYDGNGNYIQLCYDINSKNEDGSYNLVDLNYTTDSEGNINAENIVGSFIKENEKVQEIKIMHSDGDGYDIHKEINGTFYKLTSPTLPDLQNIKSATLNEDSISITTASNEILDCNIISIAGNENLCYIQYSDKNIAIYDSATKQIISAGQNNLIDLDNNSSLTPTLDGNSYVDLEKLDIKSLSYITNDDSVLSSINGYQFNTIKNPDGSNYQYSILNNNNEPNFQFIYGDLGDLLINNNSIENYYIQNFGLGIFLNLRKIDITYPPTYSGNYTATETIYAINNGNYYLLFDNTPNEDGYYNI